MIGTGIPDARRRSLRRALFIMPTLVDCVPADQSLRSIRTMVNDAMARLGPLFRQMYADGALVGRLCFSPEKLLRSMLLQRFRLQNGTDGCR